ncbi:hypothetical protein [Marinobacter sp. DUT-1]|uniref:hypothetical protein n=1 Tax=Marinobacter sp. DUT-1 TaxID=3412037 RepID=UPI003D186E8E
MTDIIVSSAAIITAATAIYGVFSWKHELKAQTAHKQAVALKVSARRLQKALDAFRDDRFFPTEYPDNYIWAEAPDYISEGKVLAYIYENRLRKLSSAFDSFEQTAIEAEAVLGKELRPLLEQLSMVHISAETCFRRLAPSFEGFFNPKDEFEVAAKQFLYADKDGDDLRSKDYERQFRNLEKFLNRFL